MLFEKIFGQGNGLSTSSFVDIPLVEKENGTRFCPFLLDRAEIRFKVKEVKLGCGIKVVSFPVPFGEEGGYVSSLWFPEGNGSECFLLISPYSAPDKEEIREKSDFFKEEIFGIVPFTFHKGERVPAECSISVKFEWTDKKMAIISFRKEEIEFFFFIVSGKMESFWDFLPVRNGVPLLDTTLNPVCDSCCGYLVADGDGSLLWLPNPSILSLGYGEWDMEKMAYELFLEKIYPLADERTFRLRYFLREEFVEMPDVFGSSFWESIPFGNVPLALKTEYGYLVISGREDEWAVAEGKIARYGFVPSARSEGIMLYSVAGRREDSVRFLRETLKEIRMGNGFLPEPDALSEYLLEDGIFRIDGGGKERVEDFPCPFFKREAPLERGKDGGMEETVPGRV